MAHTCPDCEEVCYCHGDIDDMVIDPPEKSCAHYLDCGSDDSGRESN